MPQPKFSIIIPAKDEEHRLPVFLKSVAEFCSQQPHHYEVIVVDDGSRDQTSAVANTFQSTINNLKILRLERNRGKGYAVKYGFKHAKGDILLFIDADGSTPIDEINRQTHWFDKHIDIVIGSRELTDTQTTVTAKAHRKLIGRVFNGLVNALLIKDIKDTQCGFKMFRKHAAYDVMEHVSINGFGFDLEVLFIAQRLHLHIKETAINWQHVPGSKVHLLRDSWRMFWNIFDIRRRHMLK